MNILINGIGGPTPRSIASFLRRNKPNVRLIGIDSNPKALGFYMENLVDSKYVVPRSNDSNYWKVIQDIIDKEAIDLAFVQPEQEILTWGEYYKNHQKFPCPVLIPPYEHAKLLIDKAEMSDLLEKTTFIPKTIRITPQNPKYDELEDKIGYPCWIRASVGSGGLGSLKLNRQEELQAWLFIHKNVNEFTVSEFLPGRHLANQMLYIEGKCHRNAGLHCAEYVMADVAPSKVTGNTSYGLFINNTKLLDFCEEVMEYIQNKTNVKAHGVYSFDLKEDHKGDLKVTEINVRHMAYTGIMAEIGFDLIGDTVDYLIDGGLNDAKSQHSFDENFIFLRDVDINPIVLNSEDLLQ